MTAKTSLSHLGIADIVVDKTDLRSELGKLADAYSPGDIVYESAAGVWTKAATNAGHLGRVGVVGFKARIDSTGARKDIDDAYAKNDIAPIITRAKKVGLRILDQNGSLLRGAFLALSGTAGSLTVFSSGRHPATLAAPVADDDTCALAMFDGDL